MSYLTDEDIAALVDACEGAGEYSCCYRTTMKRDRTFLNGVTIMKGTPVGGQMLDAVEAILRRHRAQALREAAELGCSNGYLGIGQADWLDLRADRIEVEQ